MQAARRELREETGACRYRLRPVFDYSAVDDPEEVSQMTEGGGGHPRGEFRSEKECLKLVFSVLWRASQRRRGVRFSEHELKQLDRNIAARQKTRQLNYSAEATVAGARPQTFHRKIWGDSP